MPVSTPVIVRYALWIAGVVGSGMIVGMLANSGMYPWYGELEKSALNPPPIAFPVAWTILYALMGFAAAWLHGRGERKLVKLFLIQLAVNLAWSFVFFTFHQVALGFVWILALLGLVSWWVAGISRLSSKIAATQLPYIAWLCFAAYLNGTIMILN